MLLCSLEIVGVCCNQMHSKSGGFWRQVLRDVYVKPGERLQLPLENMSAVSLLCLPRISYAFAVFRRLLALRVSVREFGDLGRTSFSLSLNFSYVSCYVRVGLGFKRKL